MALKLKKVRLQNWQTVREAELEFPSAGLVHVLGQNNSIQGRLKSTVSGRSSIGSGKSALGEAISRTVLGIRGRFEHFGAYSCDQTGNKDMLVDATFEGEGHRLRVEAGYKCKSLSRTGEGLRFSLDGTAVERGRLADTRRELAAALGLDALLARHTLYIDGDQLKFNRLPQSELVDLVMTVLGQADWDARKKRVAGLVSERKEELTGLKASLDAEQRHLIDREREVSEARATVADETRNFTEISASHQTRLDKAKLEKVDLTSAVKACETAVKSCKTRVAALNQKLKKEVHAADLEISKLSPAVDALNDKHVKALAGVTSLTEHKTERRRNLTEARNGGACPTCKRPYDDAAGDRQRQLEALEIALKIADDKLTGASKVLAKARADSTAKKDELRALEAKKTRLVSASRFSDLHSELDDALDGLEKARTVLSAHDVRLAELTQPPDRARVAAAEAVLAERQSALERAQVRVRELTDELTKLDKITAVLAYWERAFSPAGIPNLILRDGLGVLNHACAKLSERLTGGTLQIEYKTSRELKSGDSRPELAIQVVNQTGAGRVDGGSKGESGLTNLILAESLLAVSHAGSKLGWRWLDEVVNNQDSAVRQAIYAYLSQQAREQDLLIFVVDHHADVKDHADYALVATKDVSGVTTYAWS